MTNLHRLLRPLAVLLLTACSVPLIPPATQGILHLSVQASAARTALPTLEVDHYSATLTSATGTVTLDRLETSQAIAVAPGEVQVTIKAWSSKAALVGLGSATATMVAGDNSLSVTVVPLAEGSGTLHVEVHFVEAGVHGVDFEVAPWTSSGADSAHGALYSNLPSMTTAPLSSSGPASAASYALAPSAHTAVFDAALPSGIYLFTSRVKDSGQYTIDGGVYSEIVVIRQGLVTAKVFRNPSHNVVFDANGGQGTMAPQPIPLGQTDSLVPNTFTNAGYVFSGWQLPDESSVLDGAAFTMTDDHDVTLYALWDTPQKVQFDGNTGTGTLPDIVTFTGAQVHLPANGFSGATPFVRWNTQADGLGTSYDPGDLFTVPAGVTTLYAIWTVYRTVTFDGNTADAGGPLQQTVAVGAMVGLRANTYTKAGYGLVSWNTSSDGSGTDYADQGAFISPDANTTLYAQWSGGHQVFFDPNGGTGTTLALTIPDYMSSPLPDSQFTNGSLYFHGWNTQYDGNGANYTAGARFPMQATDVTLYAVWKAYPLLLTNPSFETELDGTRPVGWDVGNPGDNGAGGRAWAYTGVAAHSGYRQISVASNYSSSYRSHSQTVDLLAKGFTSGQLAQSLTYTFLEWANSGTDGGYAYLRIELLDAAGNVLAQSSDVATSWSSASSTYSPQWAQYTSPSGLAVAKVRVSGWAKRYSSSFSYPAGNSGPSFDDAQLFVDVPSP